MRDGPIGEKKTLKNHTAIHASLIRDARLRRVQLRIWQAAQVLPIPVEVDEDLEVWSAQLVLAASGSVQRGLQMPWYAARHKAIEDEEGGKHEVIGIVAGLALTLLANDPMLNMMDACWQAGNEWRASIRSQWDGRSGDKQGISIQRMEADRVAVGSDEGRSDYGHSKVASQLGLIIQHPADMDEEAGDPRLQAVLDLLPQLTDKQRQALDLYSGGMSLQAIADEMELSHRSNAQALIKRAKATILRLMKTERITAA